MTLPFTFRIPFITADQYFNLSSHLKNPTEVRFYTMNPDGKSGHVSTASADFDFAYVPETELLTLTVTSLNSWIIRRVATPSLIISNVQTEIGSWDQQPFVG